MSSPPVVRGCGRCEVEQAGRARARSGATRRLARLGQCARDGLIGLAAAQHQVPCAAGGLLFGQRLGQRMMGGATRGVAGTGVNGRSHQRVPEVDPSAILLQQPDTLSFIQTAGQTRVETPDDLHVVLPARRRQQQGLTA